MRCISKQRIVVTKLYAVFYKPKMTFQCSETLCLSKVYENLWEVGRNLKNKFKKSGFQHQEAAFITHILQSLMIR